MVERVRAQEERREKMDDIRTALMASCMNILEGKNNVLEVRVNSLGDSVNDVQSSISEMKEMLRAFLNSNTQ